MNACPEARRFASKCASFEEAVDHCENGGWLQWFVDAAVQDLYYSNKCDPEVDLIAYEWLDLTAHIPHLEGLRDLECLLWDNNCMDMLRMVINKRTKLETLYLRVQGKHLLVELYERIHSDYSDK